MYGTVAGSNGPSGVDGVADGLVDGAAGTAEGEPGVAVGSGVLVGLGGLASAGLGVTTVGDEADEGDGSGVAVVALATAVAGGTVDAGVGARVLDAAVGGGVGVGVGVEAGVGDGPGVALDAVVDAPDVGDAAIAVGHGDTTEIAKRPATRPAPRRARRRDRLAITARRGSTGPWSANRRRHRGTRPDRG
jgi:hypothetical protein